MLAPARGASHSRRLAFSYPVFLSLHCYQLRLKPLCHQVRPVRTCPVRASPHLTQRKTLFSSTHLSAKRRAALAPARGASHSRPLPATLYLHRLLALSSSPAPTAQALSNQYTAKHSLPVLAPARGASHLRRPAFFISCFPFSALLSTAS